MKPVAISLLTICGIDELPTHRERSVSHVLSVLDPEHPDPEVFASYSPHERTVLRFHDIIDDRDGMVAPTPQNVEAILEFGDGLKKTVADLATVICWCIAIWAFRVRRRR